MKPVLYPYHVWAGWWGRQSPQQLPGTQVQERGIAGFIPVKRIPLRGMAKPAIQTFNRPGAAAQSAGTLPLPKGRSARGRRGRLQ